jgi:threonine dehydrogenase-like Zn-dependent dehydrogenase
VKALVLGDDGLRFDPSYPDPVPQDGEALVRVLAAGICGTDLELLSGYKRFRGVPGHEFVGRVERCDSDPDLEGERVVGEINVGCRMCERCRRVGERHCARRETLGIAGRDGAFAEFLRLPARNLHLAGREDDDSDVLVEPLAAALHVLSEVEVTEETHAVVLGPGRLGRLVAMVLSTRTKHFALVGRNDAAPSYADLVVDCTGSPQGIVRALEIVTPRGTVVLKSTCASTATVPASVVTSAVVGEVAIIGSRCGDAADFDTARNAIALNSIDVSPLLESTYKLDDYARAFEHAARPGALKILLDPAE